MKLLAVDASSDACGAALWRDGDLFVRQRVLARGHAELLLPMVEDVLIEGGCTLAALDGIAFGRGPGSFTGIRIAVSVAQGLAFGAGLPVVAVSDLTALARGAWRAHGARRVFGVLDARMGEVYGAAFEIDAKGVPALIGVESVAAAAEIAVPEGEGWFIAGTGFAAYGDVFSARMGGRCVGTDGTLLPAATDIAALGALGLAAGHGTPAAAAQPTYLRDDVVHKGKPKPFAAV